MAQRDELKIGAAMVSVQDVLDVACRGRKVVLDDDPTFVGRIRAGREALEALWQKEEVVYGVTTGVGDSCVRTVPAEQSDRFALNLMRFHGCGLGAFLDEQTGRAVMLVRLVSLRTGFSAVRFELLERMVWMLNEGIIPRIPAEGSVGASGDLTPLSYVAGAIAGERDVYWKGEVRPAREVLAELGVEPFHLKAKEALAIMNGTSVMTAIACFAMRRAAQVLDLAESLTAMLVEVLHVNKGHFDPRIFALKPHPGQMSVAATIASRIRFGDGYVRNKEDRIQATYAVRCAPHILGVLADGLRWMEPMVETEINSVNDNPLVDPEVGDVLHGGNFYGGHIAFAMDCLKNAVANCADLFDRQIALLVNERRSNGLPPNLSGAPADVEAIHHGFKAVHILTSACAAEALKLAMPASVFSRSTESHNQDKVSMGTIAARDCVRVLELTEQNLAATLLAAAQALDFRLEDESLRQENLHKDLRALHATLRQVSPFVAQDRPLDGELRTLVAKIRDGQCTAPGEEER